MEHLAKRSRLRTGFYGDFVNGNYNVKIEEFEFADGTEVEHFSNRSDAAEIWDRC